MKKTTRHADRRGATPPGTKRSSPLELHEVRALAHPLRMQMIELFAEQPRTAKQVAQALGQPPTRLYHHVATLERAGLLRLCETRAVRGATEKYYAVTQNAARTAGSSALRESTSEDRRAIAATLLDRARDELTKALAPKRGARKKPLMAIRAVARLSPRAAKDLQRDLMAVLKRLRLRQRESRRDGARADRVRRSLERYALTISLVPTNE
jgi:DNA-binding transcriptional ArsR family regulator